MKFNYGYERNKMEKEFEWMKQLFLEAGMSDEAIEEIHRMLLDEVNNKRKYYTHNQSLDITNTSENEKYDESWSPYYEKHLEQFSVYQYEISEWGRYDWIEDLDTPDVILWAKKLSDTDKELITYLMVEKLQKQEVATILGCSPSAVSNRLNRIKKQLKKILPLD